MLIVLLLMLFLVIVAQNTDVVTVRLLFWDVAASQIILLALSLGVGVIVGLLLGRPWRKPKIYAHPDPSTDEDER